MIRIFRKSWRRLKRTVCAALCLVFLSSLLAVPAGAETLSGRMVDILTGAYINGTLADNHISEMQYSSQSTNQSDIVLSSTSLDAQRFIFSPWRVRFTGVNQVLDGSVGLYYSYYFRSDFEGSFSSPSVSSLSPSMRVYLSDGTYETVSVSSQLRYSTYSAPVPDGGAVSLGYLLKGRINLDSIASVATLYLSSGTSYDTKVFAINKPAGVPGSVSLVVPSVVLVTGSSSDLDALEGIADGIAAQSEILNSMYGDIMELLNDLYARLGDIQAVLETANAYFAQLIPLVNSINTSTANIYSLLQTQFQLLRTLIATESDDIQAAIEKQTDDLIAYFDTVLSGSTGAMPEKSDDLQSSVGNVSDAESNYQSTATDRFSQLADAFTGFSGGTLGGVTLAATLFTRVWDTLGEYKIVYTWPLLLGLCLVILGRMSRLSGGQSSAEKRRGDSDA